MLWWLARAFAAFVALGLGGAVGFFAGYSVGAPSVGVALGMSAGMVVALSVDGLGAARLIRWLRGAQDQPAPRDTGLWGELGYRVERALRVREADAAREVQRLAHFLSAIEASPNGVLLLDALRRIAWCNPTASVHLGVDPRRDIGQTVTNLVRVPAFVGLMHDPAPSDPITMIDPGGRMMLSVIARPYGEDQTLVITQDVTERLRQEAMRRDFVANVSHEIRTPLTVLAGFVETMSSLPLTDAERERVLGMMQQQTDRMRALVTDLLQLAQLEGSPPPGADAWVPVAALFERTRTDASSLSAGRHRISVGDAAGAAIAGADAELHSALGNLVGNALCYTPEGGEVAIEWRTRTDGTGEIEVRDSGIGIAREHLARLTERFYRVDKSRSRDTGGTGLGLAIVKHVMQRHGGSLEVDSEPGRGSRFRLVFPPARTRAAVPCAPAVSRPVSSPAA